ncbi:MAG: ATP-binding protein [Chitinispirillales bacterium]|jgi:predicted AAA+ superfamily ATPase|nr:ATP-binding protein [Chitinispirillales bacterium]
MVDRPAYLEKLIKWKDKSDFIKIVSGVRRCGKSTLLLLFREHLKKNMVAESQVISINLELAEHSELLNWEKLHDYVKARVLPDRMNYVLIDEIQMVYEFQRAVNSLRLEKNIDLYLTGSNAYMYSQKLSTLLSGRYIEVKMFPLSFKEFASSFDTERGGLRYDFLFDVYREYGGFPDIAKLLAAEFKENPRSTAFPLPNAAGGLSDAGLYLDSLYNTIIVKDISLRTGIDSVSEINRIVRFLFSNIGSETSFNGIMNSVNSEFKFTARDKNIYVSKVQKITDALLESFLFYQCDRRQLKGKELLRTNSKYYAVDTGLRYYTFGGNKAMDGGHILENIVYIELLRRGYRVYTGKVNAKEVDFVAERADTTEYYQAALSVQSEETLRRELEPLERIDDNFEKTILTLGIIPQKSYKGIKIVDTAEWLLR